MFNEVKVSLASVLTAVLWMVGGALVIGGAFLDSLTQNVGIGVLVVAATLCVRSSFRCGRDRERRAFELGRECGPEEPAGEVRSIRP